MISLQDIECCIDLIVSRSGKIALSQLLYTEVCLTKVYESKWWEAPQVLVCLRHSRWLQSMGGPDNVSMAAVSLAITGGGALSSFETIVLLTVDETMDALRKAG